MLDREEFGKLIKTNREAKGLNRKKLANLLKCTTEAVRTWETGKRRPNIKHTLQIYNFLGIKLGDGKVKNVNNIYLEYAGELLMKSSRQLTIQSKWNRIYLNKNLQKEFRYTVEILLHPHNKRELLIREKRQGKPKSIYYASEIVHKISKAVEMKGNMRFVCIWDESENGWRGILLPEMTESFLWRKVRKYTGQAIEDKTYKNDILRSLYRRYRKEVEYEEIELIYQLAYELVVCSNMFQEKQVWYLILMYSSALLDEIRRTHNRCIKAEASLSCNESLVRNSEFTLQEIWIGGQIPYSSFEIKEFLSWLTIFEKNILLLLIQGKNLVENISIGYNLKKMITKGIQDLKKKAEKYYGRQYIQSFFIMSRENI